MKKQQKFLVSNKLVMPSKYNIGLCVRTRIKARVAHI